MGPSPGDPDQRALFEVIRSLLEKGGYEILYPPDMARLCCGMPFGSKGFFEEAERKRRELESALLACSREGEYPVLFDTSPCLYTVKQDGDPRLRIYEPVEFIHSFLLDALEFTKIPETIAVHVTCSSIKLGLREKFLAVAGACAETVVIPDRAGCCGVAGDRLPRRLACRMPNRVFEQPHLRDRALPPKRFVVPVHRVPGRPVHGEEDMSVVAEGASRFLQ